MRLNQPVVGIRAYQHHPGKSADPAKLLRTLHFGRHHEGLATFLVYPPDDLVLVVQIQRLANESFIAGVRPVTAGSNAGVEGRELRSG